MRGLRLLLFHTRLAKVIIFTYVCPTKGERHMPFTHYEDIDHPVFNIPFVTHRYQRSEGCWIIEYQSINGTYACAQDMMVIPLARRWDDPRDYAFKRGE